MKAEEWVRSVCSPNIRVQKTESAPSRTKIRVICAIRVPNKNIRVIRVIRVQKNSWWHPCSKISCSKHLVRASKFIIGQFHIAASRNNSTFNIQKSKLRSAPPCAKNIFVLSELFVFKKYRVTSVFKNLVSPMWAPRREQRSVSEIRVQKKNIRVIRVIRVQNNSCSKVRSVRSVCPPKNRVNHVAPLDFFMGFFDMIVAGRRDYALMTEALLVKPV